MSRTAVLLSVLALLLLLLSTSLPLSRADGDVATADDDKGLLDGVDDILDGVGDIVENVGDIVDGLLDHQLKIDLEAHISALISVPSVIKFVRLPHLNVSAMVIVCLDGRIFWVPEGVYPAPLPQLLLDLSLKVNLDLSLDIGAQRGLLGIAFHPNFYVNGRFFVWYNVRLP